MQGMQAHVDVAAVQEQGVEALANLAVNNGVLLDHVCWRCVVCGARRVPAGGRVLLVGVA